MSLIAQLFIFAALLGVAYLIGYGILAAVRRARHRKEPQ